MRNFVLAVLILLGLGLLFFISQKQSPSSQTSNDLNSQASQEPSPTIGNLKTTTMIFVPYWTVSPQMDELSEYNALLYFGITADENGIDTSDEGYKKLNEFTQAARDNQQKYLVVRLINAEVDNKILENKDLQQKVVAQSIALAKQYDFDGIVLDFEIPALAFQSVTDSITNFHKAFYTSVKNSDLQFYITLYGDTFYRARPYDVKILGQNSDGVLIMAYDFHKSRGNPGPNFPLNGREQYGYDFAQMIENFSEAVPKNKLTVVFGLFGYDWKIDNKKNSIANGVPLSYLEIKQEFLDSCAFSPCTNTRDKTSAESEVVYQDKKTNHVVWFEDPQSVQKKIEFLKKHGISSFGYWAYSYF